MRRIGIVASTAAVCTIVFASLTWVGAVSAERAVTQRLGNGPLGRLVTGRIGRVMVLKSELNLTDAQREQVKTILLEHKGEIAAVIKPVVEKKRALRDAVIAEKADEKAIRAAASELGTTIGDAAVAFAKIKPELTKLLTADQLKLLEKFHSENDAAVDGFFKEVAP